MGKLVVSLDGVVIKEVQLTKDKTTLGRRPYNDIVIDNLAVSGEHAVLQMVGADVFIEDLNSTNGTYINGKAIKKQLLSHNDTVEIGKYKIKYLTEEAPDYEKTLVMKPGALPGAAPAPSTGLGGVASPLAGGLAFRLRRVGGKHGGSGVDQGAQWRGCGARGQPEQGRDDGGQAGCAGGLDYQAPGWLCIRPCRRGDEAHGERLAGGQRPHSPQEW